MTATDRRRKGLLGLFAFLAATAAPLLWSAPVVAQPPPRVPFGQGTHALRHILHKANLRPLTSQTELRQALEVGAEDAVLVIALGQASLLARFPGGIEDFIRRGGALLMATDQRSPSIFNTQVPGHFVYIAAQSKAAYRGSGDCPIVIPEAAGGCPVFRGLHKVATNRPSYLIHDRGARLPTVARFPDGSIVVNAQNMLIFPRSFAVGRDVGSGRVLLMADHSVFINEMMLQTDNDNFDMACNAVNWLTNNGERNRVLFIEDDRIVTKFDVPVKDMPLPPLPTPEQLLRKVDPWLAGLERENFFDRQLRKIIPQGAVQLILVLLITGLLVVLGLWRLVRSRHQIDPRVPLLVPSLEGLTRPGAVVEQRQQALLQDGNFWETAHGFARQFFDQALGQARNASSGVPEVHGVGDRRQQRTWQQQVARLWRLARGAPAPVSSVELETVVAQVSGWTAALASGTLSLRQAGS
jgi:hypothetical protein